MIGCVIPCYKAGKIILDIVEKALNYVDFVVIVDDKCPFNSGHLINKEFNDKRVDVIFNEKNLGVGGAVKIGFNYLIQKNCKFIIKIDADGQMDPSLIPKILAPLVNGEADAVKGNRYFARLMNTNRIKQKLIDAGVTGLPEKPEGSYSGKTRA